MAARASRLTTILTTHSPHIASIAPLRSLVLLRRDGAGDRTVGVSTAKTPLTAADEADLQRYIDVTRGELFFARGIILVEGDAERFLVPAFAEALDIRLDQRGISVCSVGGTNFAPYVKLLGPAGLAIPHVVLTDLDPVEAGTPLARAAGSEAFRDSASQEPLMAISPTPRSSAAASGTAFSSTATRWSRSSSPLDSRAEWARS